MSIRVSEKYGVNPSLSQCFFCGGDKNELLLFGRLPGDKEAPRKAVYSHEPCDTCKSYMEQGIMLISVRAKDIEYRTGNLCVIKEEAIKRMLDEPLLSNVLKQRFLFINDADWKLLGLPTAEEGT